MNRFGGRSGCAIATALLIAGCSKPREPPPAGQPAQSVSAGPAGTSRVVGRAAVTPGGGAVVVVLEPKTARTFAPQSETPVMDQVGQTFGPELLLVRTGQPVEFRNSDDTLHNVHVSHEETHEPAFNVAIPTGGSYSFTFAHDGFYRVGCDIHPSMAASIFAASTPFTTLADADGTFTFDEVPEGPWIVTVYASGHRLTRDLDVHGAAAQVDVP